MSDAHLRQLEQIFRHTGSQSDEADWVAARIQAGFLDEERVRLAAKLGHQASRIIFPCEMIASNDTQTWFEACTTTPRAQERAAYGYAISVIREEPESKGLEWTSSLSHGDKQTLKTIGRFILTHNRDHFSLAPEVTLQCAHSAMYELSPDNQLSPKKKRSSTSIIIEQLVYGICPDSNAKLTQLLLAPVTSPKGTLYYQTAIPRMKRAVIPWLLDSYDPIQLTLKELS